MVEERRSERLKVGYGGLEGMGVWVGVGDDIVRGIVCTMFYIFLKHR